MFSKTQRNLNLNKFHLTALIFAAISLILANLYATDATAQKNKPESPKRVLVVKDYKWSSAGMGRPAIMSEITIENRGENDYQDIAIEVDLYSANDIPLGSMRTSINEILPAKSEKTFYNCSFRRTKTCHFTFDHYDCVADGRSN